MVVKNCETPAMGNEESAIRKFYSGKTILITGATSSFGKLVVEKLLRECFDLNKIFILMRTKKGCSLNERKEQFLNNVIFDKLKSQQCAIEQKLAFIEGDITKEKLGLSNIDWITVLGETQFILHNASTVKHKNDVKITLNVNVLGTKNMLDFARECKKVEVFMYVSTVFAHLPEEDIKDDFYRAAADLKFTKDLLQAEEETCGLTKDAIADALGKWHDMHVFSRSAAENLIQDCGRSSQFSCGVFRPSMMIPTYHEPIEGWSEEIDDPTFICLGTALGCIHTTYMLNGSLDCVPMDMCANALIASTWHLVTKEKETKKSSVYNYGSSVVNPVSTKRFYLLAMEEAAKSPPSKQFWSAFNIITDNIWLFHILHVIFHIIPALISCGVKFFKGGMDLKKCCPKGEKNQTNHCCLISKFKSVIYFCNGKWRVHVNQMEAVWNQMNNYDKKCFTSDLRDIKWNDYFPVYWRGCRMYLLKDPLSTIPEAKKNTEKLNLIHNVITIISSLILVYFFVTKCLY